jgi:hypothetical protein
MLRKLVKLLPGATDLYERFVQGPKVMRLSPIDDLKPFAPNVAGGNRERNSLTLETANRIGIVFRDSLSAFLQPIQIVDSADFARHFGLEADLSADLRNLFSRHDSDKSSTHDYHLVYGRLFEDPNSVRLVVEIGIGTDSPDVLSTMGRGHAGVGGSLRAWRDFFPSASIIGYDIDPRALFEGVRIRTAVLDQRNEDSIKDEFDKLEDGSVDLYIDDGLHSLDANLLPIRHAFSKIRSGGWLVVEDIHAEAVPFWEAFGSAIPAFRGRAAIVVAQAAYLFVLQKAPTHDLSNLI